MKSTHIYRSLLINDDCINYLKSCKDDSFDIAIVDPPYGLPNSSKRGAGKLKNRIFPKSKIDWDIAPTEEYFKELFRVSKNQIIFGGNYFKLPPCRCFVIWDKMQNFENFSQCEFAWTSFKKPAKIFSMRSSGNYRRKCNWHPTSKPILLYEYLIEKFTKEGDTILDTHLGSGTIAVAANNTGRFLVGIEKNEDYYNKAIDFVKEHTQIELRF